MQLSLEQGRYLVKLAREVIREYLNSNLRPLVGSAAVKQYLIDKRKSEKEPYPEFEEPRGVFCTLNNYPAKDLRGCIGLPYPDKPLKEAVISAAIDSTQDPRFPSLSTGELTRVTIELSILTKPELIEVQKTEEYLEKIEQGKDGLILEYKDLGSGALVARGLFLPQVWEQLPNKELFLTNLCYKANIWNPNAWKDPNAQLLKFRVQIFEEKRPQGEIEEKPI